MGVRGFWPLLAPIQEYRPLPELGGQTVAVDLSIWVCGDMSIPYGSSIMQKLYLRNLFFRTVGLLRQSTLPVVVLDGVAPKLKVPTIASRQRIMRRANNFQVSASALVSRRRLRAISAECCTLLNALGVPWVQSPGEAEAMCALLNSSGRVDACITNDGDAFLYGAPIVYRNFTMGSRDASVRMYRFDRVQNDLHLARCHLVLLALLLGCDYWPHGVPGVGVNVATHLIASVQHLDQTELLEFLTLAINEFDRNESIQLSSLCGKNCLNPKILPWWIKVVAALRCCPINEIFDEYLSHSDLHIWQVPSVFRWVRPDLKILVSFCCEKLDWNPDYILHHFLPILALWGLRHPRISRDFPADDLVPLRIIKKRVVKAVPSYEVEWKLLEFDTWTSMAGLLTKSRTKITSNCAVNSYVFCIPVTEFEHVYPDLCLQFAASKAPARPTKFRKRLDRSSPTLSNLLNTLNLDDPPGDISNVARSPLQILESDPATSCFGVQNSVHLTTTESLTTAFQLEACNGSPFLSNQNTLLEHSLFLSSPSTNNPMLRDRWSDDCSNVSSYDDSFAAFKTPACLRDRLPKIVR